MSAGQLQELAFQSPAVPMAISDFPIMEQEALTGDNTSYDSYGTERDSLRRKNTLSSYKS